METRKFRFSGNINGQMKELIVEAPVMGGGVYTNKHCPDALLDSVLGRSFHPTWMGNLNGESIEEFTSDCQKQVTGMEAAGRLASLLDIHVAGLMGTVMEHLARCGRLLSVDLLLYMDCFALLLEADGFTSKEIARIYPHTAKTITNLYSDRVFNARDLSPFKGGPTDAVLSSLIQN